MPSAGAYSRMNKRNPVEQASTDKLPGSRSGKKPLMVVIRLTD